MTDKISRAKRSANMAAIRSKDTSPEIAVRRYLHSNGLRFRLHASELPGKPDVVFPRRRCVVFIHGCFWHGCTKCVDGTRTVKSRTRYWTKKIGANKARDLAHQAALESLGWKGLVIWECKVGDAKCLRRLVRSIAHSTKHKSANRAAAV